jgi:hypothetical protein
MFACGEDGRLRSSRTDFLSARARRAAQPGIEEGVPTPGAHPRDAEFLRSSRAIRNKFGGRREGVLQETRDPCPNTHGRETRASRPQQTSSPR